MAGGWFIDGCNAFVSASGGSVNENGALSLSDRINPNASSTQSRAFALGVNVVRPLVLPADVAVLTRN